MAQPVARLLELTAWKGEAAIMRGKSVLFLLLALAGIWCGGCVSTNESGMKADTGAPQAVPTNLVASTNAASMTNTVSRELLLKTAWKGLVFPAPENAPSRALALLKQEKTQKAGYYLRAENPILISRLRELGQSHKGTRVALTARLDPDGATLLVIDMAELAKEHKPERR